MTVTETMRRYLLVEKREAMLEGTQEYAEEKVEMMGVDLAGMHSLTFSSDG